MQEELKILRLRYSVLQEEELENQEKELTEKLKAKKEASVSCLFCHFKVLYVFCLFLLSHVFIHILNSIEKTAVTYLYCGVLC